MQDIPLYDLAHARTGDKGNIVNISLIAYREQDYPLLVAQVTPRLASDACLVPREWLSPRWTLIA